MNFSFFLRLLHISVEKKVIKFINSWRGRFREGHRPPVTGDLLVLNQGITVCTLLFHNAVNHFNFNLRLVDTIRLEN